MARRASIEKICRLIDALLPKCCPVIEDVASLLCVSPRSLQRLLNEDGVSYSDLVDRCRCKAACESLEHTQQPIKDIAAALGYSDPTHFSRAFRRIAGLNPRQYRQAYSQCCGKDAPVADCFVDLSHTGH
jgi:AraC-like DNA-binding protein